MKIRLSASSKLLRLLDMEYTPAELANEIGAQTTQVQYLVSTGLPVRRSENGRVWINGETFANWVQTTGRPKRARMKDGEYYCLRCRKYVTGKGVKIVKKWNKLAMVATCPNCGIEVRKFAKVTK